MTKLSTSLRAGVLLAAASLLLAGCASTRLDEAPVTDGKAGVAAAQPAATKPAAASTVAPVVANKAPTDLAGPNGAAKTIYFDYDSASIRPEFRPVLDEHAHYLVSHKDRKLTIGGHTDERGGHEYNIALGQQRAEAVRQVLQLLGVKPAQVEAVSFGEEKPAAEGHEEAAWSRNRRAELAYH